MLLNSTSENIIIGYDLTNTSSQISYRYLKSGSQVETLTAVAGQENYDIPTVLCKKCGVNQWLFGKDALRFYENDPLEGILVDDLLQLAIKGEMVQLGGKGYDPIALLTLFVKRSLGLLSHIAAMDKIYGILFTCEELTPRVIEVLTMVVNGLDLKNTKVYFQNYEESYYGYMLHQQKELWKEQSILFDYRGDTVKVMKLHKNVKTTPIVVYADKMEKSFGGSDKAFLELAKEVMTEEAISSVYLIGEKFAGGWMEESLRFLCEGRRVFQGNNLYSKGACYCLSERLMPTPMGKEHVFLGEDKLKSNIGMFVLKRGQESYFAILDAGVDWRDISFECEIYLQDESSLELVVTPLLGGKVKMVELPLEGLYLKQGETTRIYMKFTMPRENLLNMEIEDLGFGMFREPVETVWKKEIALD